jgi:hypothetical protein
MSGASRRRESLAPSLFPFLAVLLCTMGALVLILMLLVSGAQNTAHESARQADEEFEWEQEKIRLVKNKLNSKYEEAKIELEKKRLVLQNYEKHIQELMEELAQLEKKSEQAEQNQDTRQQTEKERDQLRLALEKQLADAQKKLDQKLDDPKGDKPIFAIIPYEGPNGTHRRPIYLECNERGVIVQPEGVALTPADLRPPYGPGNPLDAVLRTIRAEYPAKNGAVTYNPYPLLVVRPSGIKHYMMAKAAMSGWDDQHGYELISEDLELTFPPSAPGLEDKIATAIDLARQRQAALVMAMPQHYDAAQLESFNSGGGYAQNANLEGFDDPPLQVAGSGQGSEANGQTGLRGAGGRGGVSMLANSAQGSSNSATGLSSAAGNSAPLTMAQAASSGMPGQAAASELGQPTSPGVASGSAEGSGPLSFFGSGNRNDTGGGSASGGFSSTGNSTSTTLEKNGSGQSMASSTGELGSTGVAGAGVGGSADSNSPGSDPQSNTAGNSKSETASSSSRKSRGQSSSGGDGGTAAPFGGGSQSSLSSNATGSSNSSPGESSNGSNADPGQAGGVPSVNLDLSNKRNDSVKPVALTRGRNWAWRDGNRSKTSIVRAIRLQCYSDRWVLLPEKGSNSPPIVITFDGPPVERAEKLAQAVGQRVESWGMALNNGHWAPVLHVNVAEEAEWRFQQLQRLMEGSGIDVVRKAKIASPPR